VAEQIRTPQPRSPFHPGSLVTVRPSGGAGGIKLGPPLNFSRPTGQKALISIEVEVDQFNKTLRQFAEKLGNATQAAVDSVTLELLNRIQSRTPVDTGRARASWHAVLDGQSDAYMYSDDRGTSSHGTVAVDAAPFTGWVATNVPYMKLLEAGHSRQAPNGMVVIALMEMRGALAAKIKMELGKSSG
jgi:hypothetical protein